MRQGISLVVALGLLSGCGKTSRNTGQSTQGAVGIPCSIASASSSKSLSFKQEAPRGKLQINRRPWLIHDDFALGVSAMKSASSEIPSGTRFVALLSGSCRARGLEFENSPGERNVKVTLTQDMSVAELEERVEESSCVELVGDEVTYSIEEIEPRDPVIHPELNLSHLKAIHAPDAVKFFFDPQEGIKEDVVLAVIDTGVDISHQDLSANIWVNTQEIAGNQIDDDGNGYVDDVYGYNFYNRVPSPVPMFWPPPYTGRESHGTHVAGLAAAAYDNGLGYSGVMGKHMKIMALNVFGSLQGAETDRVANAIDYAIQKGAHIINLSLGSFQHSSVIEAALRRAVSAGITVFAAAGNSHTVINDDFFFNPAAYAATIPGVVSVASTDAITASLSSFSNCNPDYVKIAAPGSDSSALGLMATVPNNQYGRKQGTSMASPVAAGAAGLVLGYFMSHGEKLTPAELDGILRSHSRKEEHLMDSVAQGNLLDLTPLVEFLRDHFN